MMLEHGMEEAIVKEKAVHGLSHYAGWSAHKNGTRDMQYYVTSDRVKKTTMEFMRIAGAEWSRGLLLPRPGGSSPKLSWAILIFFVTTIVEVPRHIAWNQVYVCL